MTDTAVLAHHLAPLQPLLAAKDVTELVVNRPYEVGVEGAGGWRWRHVPELSASWIWTLATAAAAYTRQDVTAAEPICSTVLPGGERCQIVLPPAAAAEMASITIRKPSAIDFALSDLVRAGMFSDARRPDRARRDEDARLAELHAAGDWPAFLEVAVRARKNLLISGATGSGKTTLSKALIRLIPEHERLVTIEDARELTVPHRNVVHLLYSKDGQGLAKVGPKQLLESALRMRPDRILLQELRDGTAFFYLRNVNSGHPGSITTVHADSAELAFEQLTLLVKESEGGRDLARDDIRALLRVLVDVVVQLKKTDGRFRVTEIHYEPDRDLNARR